MNFQQTPVPDDWQPPADAETITFSTDHHGQTLLHDGVKYPVTVTVHEDGSVEIRSERTP